MNGDTREAVSNERLGLTWRPSAYVPSNQRSLGIALISTEPNANPSNAHGEGARYDPYTPELTLGRVLA